MTKHRLTSCVFFRLQVICRTSTVRRHKGSTDPPGVPWVWICRRGSTVTLSLLPLDGDAHGKDPRGSVRGLSKCRPARKHESAGIPPTPGKVSLYIFLEVRLAVAEKQLNVLNHLHLRWWLWTTCLSFCGRSGKDTRKTKTKGKSTSTTRRRTAKKEEDGSPTCK